jgi:hypothetical protein
LFWIDSASTIQQCGGVVLLVPCLLDVPPVLVMAAAEIDIGGDVRGGGQI